MRHDIESLLHADIPMPSGTHLYDFQKEEIRKQLKFLADSSKTGVCGLLNASEQGTGKTAMTLGLLNLLQVKRDILIVCPAAVRGVWEAEVRRFLNVKQVTTATIFSGHQIKEAHNAKVIIVSYDLAAKTNVLRVLLQRKTTAIICDEAHYLRNGRTKRTRAVFGKLWGNSTYRILLTGTPFVTRIVDAFTLFSACCPVDFPTFSSFADQYSFKRETPWATEYYGVKNPKVLSELVRGKFYTRVTKKEALPELPDRTYQIVQLDEKYKANGLEGLEVVEGKIEANEDIGLSPAMASIRREQGIKKVPAIVQFLKDFLEQAIPVVCFTYHTAVMDAIKHALADHNPACIDGRTPGSARAGEVAKFQDGKTNLFLGQVIAAGTGITLTRSSTTVIAEPVWEPGVLNQALDRQHRIGQKNSVNAYFMCVKGSLDETITQKLIERERAFNLVLGDKK